MRTYLFSFSLLLLSLCAAQAAVSWDKDEGWQSHSGITQYVWHNTEDAQTGVQAMEHAREAYEKGENMKALAFYKKVYSRYPDSILAPEAYFQAAQIRVERHQYTDAIKAYNSILKDYPDYPKFNQVIRRKFEVATYLMQGERPYYWGLIPGFKDYHGAIKYFEGTIKNAPFDDLAPQALMNIAIISQQHGKPDETIDALERLISDYPHSEIAPKGYIMLAKAHLKLVFGPEYDQGSTHEALGYFQDFTMLYPEHTLLMEANKGIDTCKELLAQNKLYLGDFYYNYRNDTDAALVFYGESTSVSPEAPAAHKAEAQIEKINAGIEPPMSPADLIFGRYENPEDKEEPL